MGTALKILALPAALVIAALFGFILARSGRVETYQKVRLVLIKAVTDQAGPGQLLVLGDSIVEMQSLPPLCGLVSINAGVSGGRSRDLTGFAASAIALSKPSRVVFAVGVNDLHQGAALDAWTAQTTNMVDRWPGRPIVVGITVPSGSSRSMAERMNAVLRDLAKARGGVFVEGLAEHETYDGVHPSLAGSRAWQSRIEAACRAVAP